MGLLQSITSTATNVVTQTAQVVGGAVDAAGKNVSQTAQKAAANAAGDPLGTAAGVMVAVSAAPAIAIVAPTAISVAAVGYGAAAVTDAAGLTTGARAELEKDARYLVEHPADVSREIAGAELLVAGAFAGGGLAGKIGGALGGVLGPGSAPSTTQAPASSSSSKPAPKITPPKPGATHTLAPPPGLSAVPGTPARAPQTDSAWPGLIPWLVSFFRGDR